MKKVLVTGGAGFIGSHLVRRLLDDDHYVIVIDHFSKGKKRNLPESVNLEILEADILGEIGHHFFGVDTVYHLAALTRPQESIQDPEHTTEVNVLGTLKVLEYCRDYKVRRLVFASSTSLYGSQDVFPTPEDAEPKPMSPYALSKLVGEEYCKLFERMYGLECNFVRPFNVYGPRQNPTGAYAAAVTKFVHLLKQRKKPWITGDGKQSRDYIYVSDVVDLMILMANSEVYGEAFNAGSGTSTSINKIYKLVSETLGSSIKPYYVDPVFEPPKTQGDISKAKRLLGWEPKVSLEEGLRRTIEGTVI